MADFNIDLLRSDTNHQTTDFIHMFANAFYPTISKPARVTKQTATLIDNIIINIHEYSIKSGILYNDISDHFPIFTFYELGVKRENEYKIVYKSKLKTQLQTSNWEEVYKDQNNCSSYDTFLEILNTQMNECLPWKKIKMKTCKSEWLTKIILISCRQKNHLFKIFKCNPSTENEIIYKNYKNKLTHVMRQSKKKYFKDKF